MCVCVGGGGGGVCDNSTSFTAKYTAHRGHRGISPLALLKWLTFYASLNFRFPGRNGIAHLSGMTTIYFSMILFS